MRRIIDFDDSYSFAFLEDRDIDIQHPVSDYYFKLNDLSINLLISLKWIKWGYKFFTSIAGELDELGEEYILSSLIFKSIQKSEIFNLAEVAKLIIVDDRVIETAEDFTFQLKNFYSLPHFDENTKVHLELKLNLREYLILSNCLFPTFVKFID